MKKTVIIVPCYNEEKRINSEEFIDFLKICQDVHFLFVNDGSKDRTLAILEKMAEKSGNCKIINQEKNQGKAFAVYSGFNTAFKEDCKYIGYWDADLATPLSCIPKFCALLETGPMQAVFGCRILRLGSNIKRSAFRHYIGRCFATLISLILKLPIYDSQCGAKIFCNSEELRKVFSTPFTTKWVFDVELIARIQTV